MGLDTDLETELKSTHSTHWKAESMESQSENTCQTRSDFCRI